MMSATDSDAALEALETFRRDLQERASDLNLRGQWGAIAQGEVPLTASSRRVSAQHRFAHLRSGVQKATVSGACITALYR
jgi:hypothetical protein